VIALVDEASSAGARKHKACELLGISLRTLERWKKAGDDLGDRRQTSKRSPSNKLTQAEKQTILTLANSEKYCDFPPSKIVPMLADEGSYIASESSFYRVLREEKQVTRRNQPCSTHRSKPKSFIAHTPNQVWSWDITYLATQVLGCFYYLYMTMDIYSRKIVGFNIHDTQSCSHAANLITQACVDENIEKKQLVLHSDNGGPMKGATMLARLEKLGVMPSFSRPCVSDDNPYSESLFKTLKYHPTYPLVDKFETISDARHWVEAFVGWYNNKHLHSGLKFVTPHQRHMGEDKNILLKRDSVYQQAKQRNPNRWSGTTRNWSLSGVVLLNPNSGIKKKYGQKGKKMILVA